MRLLGYLVVILGIMLATAGPGFAYVLGLSPVFGGLLFVVGVAVAALGFYLVDSGKKT